MAQRKQKLTERAKRYAQRCKVRGIYEESPGAMTQGFRDGYRAAMRDLRDELKPREDDTHTLRQLERARALATDYARLQ